MVVVIFTSMVPINLRAKVRGESMLSVRVGIKSMRRVWVRV